ncbi:MAG: exodeoxyribonuclease VII large subunit [Clostridia bacterium]|jgi:exodeoxyribonuclease VII large subunit|nr:exodeoxyribonuclease VII large subunit [Clostridia bacterium]
MEYKAISVTDLNYYIKNKIADDEYLNNVLIKGEISNFKHHYTGHMYFTLKDDNSLIKCIMFKSYTTNLKFVPKDGMSVLAFGTVSVFERDGVYQLYCKGMQEDGMGSLYTAYEQLKEKLDKEGLFKEENKKKLPIMPKIIGVLTSNTGSVIKDIINVSTRRNPNVYIRLYPVPVQGEGAGAKIAEAIKIMNDKKLADVLILARGGGSLEDLWPFNEEIVARAIYNSEIPIVSAVGHETDFSISDFVADLRAPTPSAAAEIVVPNIVNIKQNLDTYNIRLKNSLKKKVEIMKMRYEKCMKSRIYTDSLKIVNDNYLKLDIITKSIINSMNKKMQLSKTEAIKNFSKLDALSPLKTLSRGYSILEKDTRIVKDAQELQKDDIVKIRLSNGNKEAKIL